MSEYRKPRSPPLLDRAVSSHDTGDTTDPPYGHDPTDSPRPGPSNEPSLSELELKVQDLISKQFEVKMAEFAANYQESVQSSDALEVRPVYQTKKVKKVKKARKRVRKASESDTGSVSSGDKYLRSSPAKKKSKKAKKKSKKHKYSSSSDSSVSSFPSTDTTSDEGRYVKTMAKKGKGKKADPRPAVRLRSVMRTALETCFESVKPSEMISQCALKYTGLKGIKESFYKEMDEDVSMTENVKRVENALGTLQSAILSALAAISPVANRLANEKRYTSLTQGMNDGLEVLATASRFATYKRFENVSKSVSTDAGKEVTRTRKITDHRGKEFYLYLPPKPVKGKKWDHSLLYGGQLHLHLNRVEKKCKADRQLGFPRAFESQGRYRRGSRQTRYAGPSFRGFAGNPRGRGWRTTPWAERERQGQGRPQYGQSRAGPAPQQK